MRSSTAGEHEQALDARRRARRPLRGERQRARPHLGSGRAGADPDPARAGRPGRRHARLARNHHPRDRQRRLHRLRPGRGRPRPRRTRTDTTRAAALLAEIEANPGAARPSTTPSSCRRWCAPPSRSATRNSPNGSWPVSSPAPPTPSTRSSPRTPPSPKPTATSRPPPTGTPTPPSAGSRSVSFPSRRSPSSARAAASSPLGRTAEASPVLQQAREIFQALQAAPALAETDLLLQQATALSS